MIETAATPLMTAHQKSPNNRAQFAFWLVSLVVAYLCGRSSVAMKSASNFNITSVDGRAQKGFAQSRVYTTPQGGGRVNEKQDEPSPDIDKQRQRYLNSVEQFTDAEARRRQTEYAPVLEALGVSGDKADLVLSNMYSLHKEAMFAGDKMMEFLTTKNQLVKSLEKELGSDAFQAYKAYEQNKPYRREAVEF